MVAPETTSRPSTRSRASTAVPGWRPTPGAAEVEQRFPPRPAQSSWPVTAQTRAQLLQWLLAPPFASAGPAGHRHQRRGVLRMLDWLESLPGHTWQDRWIASGAQDTRQWRQLPARWLTASNRLSPGNRRPDSGLSGGLLLLICADVIRPSTAWLLAPSGLRNLTAEIARTRDHSGFDTLRRLCAAEKSSPLTRDISLRRIAIIMASKGGPVTDITAGDCLELTRLTREFRRSLSTGMYFYQLLHSMKVFPAQAPPTVRMFTTQGQLSAEQLIARYDLACHPIRDLLVDYLREQQLVVDHATLRAMANILGNLFWRDLERHHPGIGSLHLTAEMAAGWKQRILTRPARSTPPGGDVIQVQVPRAAAGALFTVRAFYLDIIQWALINHVPMNDVHEILLALDVNSGRIECSFDTWRCKASA